MILFLWLTIIYLCASEAQISYHTCCQQATFVLVMDTSGTAVHIISHKLP